MRPSGFEDKQAPYSADDPRMLVGQIRRLGDAGPAYEIMKVEENGDTHIEIITTGEMAVFPLAEIMEDPMTETIP